MAAEISTSTRRRWSSTTAAASSSSAPARNAGCGCSIATGLGGEDHRTTLHTTPLICNDAQAFDAEGNWGRARRWPGRSGQAVGPGAVLGAVSKTFQGRRSSMRGTTVGGVAAFTLQQRRGRMGAGAGMAVARHGSRRLGGDANGVVFAYAAGEDASQDDPRQGVERTRGASYGGGLSSGPVRRIPTRARRGAVCADGHTGKELWSSGRAISRGTTSAAHRRERPRVSRDFRWGALLLRHPTIAA
jgi:hypothetical protein